MLTVASRLCTNRLGRQDLPAGARTVGTSGPPIDIVVVTGARKEKAKPRPAAAGSARERENHVLTDGRLAPKPRPSARGSASVDGTRRARFGVSRPGTNQSPSSHRESSWALVSFPTPLDRPVFHRLLGLGVLDRLLTQAWEVKANVELVEKLRGVCRGSRICGFVEVAVTPASRSTSALSTRREAIRRAVSLANPALPIRRPTRVRWRVDGTIRG